MGQLPATLFSKWTLISSVVKENCHTSTYTSTCIEMKRWKHTFHIYIVFKHNLAQIKARRLVGYMACIGNHLHRIRKIDYFDCQHRMSKLWKRCPVGTSHIWPWGNHSLFRQYHIPAISRSSVTYPIDILFTNNICIGHFHLGLAWLIKPCKCLLARDVFLYLCMLD